MFYHGTVRADNPYSNPGCGFPLFTQIAWKEYGRFGAYYYVFKGLLWSFVSNTFYPYQISHFSTLNDLYNSDRLNYQLISHYTETNTSNDYRGYLNSNKYRNGED
jgi:hypothetical protein